MGDCLLCKAAQENEQNPDTLCDECGWAESNWSDGLALDIEFPHLDMPKEQDDE